MPAQSYEPMAKEGAHWVMKASGEAILDGHHILAVRGDTTIDNMVYKKIYRQDVFVAEGAELEAPYLMTGEILLAAIRDDIVEEKVYARFFQDYVWKVEHCGIMGEEYVLYDFSLLAGGILPSCSTWLEDAPYTVDSIVQMSAWGGTREHQYYTSSLNYYGGFLMEGIGTAFGPLTPGGILFHPAGGIYLKDYCVGTDDDCNIVFTNDEEKHLDHFFKIYPNPVDGHLFIEIKKTGRPFQSIALYNNMGQMVFEKGLMPGEAFITMNMENYGCGVYYLAVVDNKGKKMYKKITKLNS